MYSKNKNVGPAIIYVSKNKWEDLKDNLAGAEMYELFVLYYGVYGLKMLANNSAGNSYYIYSWNNDDFTNLNFTKLS